MSTLYEQYEKYHYQLDASMIKDLQDKAVEEELLIRDLDEIEEWRREQDRIEKEGKPKEAEEQRTQPGGSKSAKGKGRKAGEEQKNKTGDRRKQAWLGRYG